MTPRKMLTNVLLSTVICGSLSMAAAPAFAKDKEKEKNKSIAQLSADWFQWQAANYPDFSFGEGLVDCALGQRGNIWFLGGTGGGDAVERVCLDGIPRGKQLFFPLVNLVVWDEPLNTTERRQLLDDIYSDQVPGLFAAEACGLSAAVDGKPVIFHATPIERVQSPGFHYLGDPKAVADGFWVLLPKLGRGEHTVRFTGGLCQFGSNISFFNVDVTYRLTIR